MDTFTRISYQHARSLTLHYSSSFGLSSKLFTTRIRPHIYAVYGLVRIADEIVDTYQGNDQKQLLEALEAETYAAIDRQYSPHPIVHAFALTAQKYAIDRELIAPFFESMRMDLAPRNYTPAMYKDYIHGSAEVIGLMCLRVFCEGNDTFYTQLAPNATSLGAAFQKVNFLRDLAEDYKELGRLYFPGMTFDTFDNEARDKIIAEIEHDFTVAAQGIKRLPPTCRGAVETSYVYYRELLSRLSRTSAKSIKSQRVRVPTARKLQLLAVAAIKQKLAR